MAFAARSELAPQRTRSMGDEEAGETVADLPRFEADVEAIRGADLRAAAAAASARGDPTGAGAPRLGNGRPRITTTAPWAMGARPAPPAGRDAPPRRGRRRAGKSGTSPEKRSGVGLRSVSSWAVSPPIGRPTPRSPPPPRRRRSWTTARVFPQTQQPARGGHDLRRAVRRRRRRRTPPSCCVFQRTYCWTDDKSRVVADAFQGGGRAAEPQRTSLRTVPAGASSARSRRRRRRVEPRESLLCLDGQQR